MNQLMQGKKGIIFGVANDRSIAYGITKNFSEQGAQIALTYQNERLKSRVEAIQGKLDGITIVGECDVTNPDHLQSVVQKLKDQYGSIDFVVHSVAFSDKNELKGRYVDTTIENFKNTMVISCYSLVAMLKALEPLLNDQASVMTLTYYGAEKVIPNYNVMGVAKAALEASVKYLATDLGSKGVRVNAISAGAISTLAANGIDNFKTMLKLGSDFSPLRRGVTTDEVGKVALFLASNLSTGTTGSVIYVDAGFHSVGLSFDEE